MLGWLIKTSVVGYDREKPIFSALFSSAAGILRPDELLARGEQMNTFRLEPFPILKTDHLILRQLSVSDIGTIFEVFSDDQVTQYYDLETFTNFEQAEKLIAHFQARYEQREGIRWAITRRDNGEMIGTCGFNGFNRQASRAVIGYDLLRSSWGQGVAGQAVAGMLEFGFRRLELHRIEAYVDPENAASVRVLEKLGFRREGVLRDHGFWKGKYWDVVCFSKLRTDGS
jgi:[ribosomal protein S5]-alanine N-acetyltransferase